MSWRQMETAPQDGTAIIVRFPLQGNVKCIAHYNTVHKFWMRNGEPFWPVQQKCEWAATPPDAAPSAASAAPSKFGSPELQAMIVQHASAAPALQDERAKFDVWWSEFKESHDEWMFADTDALRWAAWQAALAESSAKPALTDEQISAVARYLSDYSSAQCGVDKDDAWKVYGNDEIAVLRDALAAAGIKEQP